MIASWDVPSDRVENLRLAGFKYFTKLALKWGRNSKSVSKNRNERKTTADLFFWSLLSELIGKRTVVTSWFKAFTKELILNGECLMAINVSSSNEDFVVQKI